MAGTSDQPSLQGSGATDPTTPIQSQMGGVEATPSFTQQRGRTSQVAGTGGRALALNLTQRPQDSSVPPKEKTRAEIAADFRKLKIATDQVEPRGTLNFPANAFPRCMASRLLWRDYLTNDDLAIMTTEERRLGKEFVWVSVYKTMTITESEVILFAEGLKIAKEEAVIADFDPSHYATEVPPKGAKAFLVSVANADALKRLMKNKVWTVRTKSKSATFFLSHDDTWGTHVIYDIHNGGADFVKDVLPRLYRHCGAAIATKETDKRNAVAFRDLAYHKVPRNDKTHKGAKGIVWRVRFHATPDANRTTWQAPRHLGISSKGTVEVRRPPLCSHCISYSHPQNLCKWWTDDLVAGSKTTPENFMETTWVDVGTVSLQKLGIHAT